MRRREAAAVVAVSLGMVITSVTLLFGAFGLLGAGVVLLAVTLFVIDVEG